MRVLRARIYDVKRKQLEEERSEQRKQQIGTGERHERIRTYNFPQVSKFHLHTQYLRQ